MKTMELFRHQIWDGTLIVVNRTHPYRSVAGVQLAEIGAGIKMQSRAAGALLECIRNVGGQGKIVPVSGWRSARQQMQIWNDTLCQEGEMFTERYVARPGCSEHQTGLAIDLGQAADVIDFIRPDFPFDGVCGAFRRRATRWGFVQRYRAGKEEITEIAEEPWHFRYVGTPHAQILEHNDLCLEEYTEFLKRGPVTFSPDEKITAQIFYVPCMGERTVCTVPDGCVQISGDNCDGFIVTVWR
ncbi:D-alanyl-D-alanine carboxypeptidase family protein [uncultured Ruthenibacterium sp.]|uniref:D-alanyl-D-alanine carboxypeptidase family protein n=1 Tax=uncultured Ruthenibacterium sp. TaxID=1905347 RepID=UPI00349E5C81